MGTNNNITTRGMYKRIRSQTNTFKKGHIYRQIIYDVDKL